LVAVLASRKANAEKSIEQLRKTVKYGSVKEGLEPADKTLQEPGALGEGGATKDLSSDIDPKPPVNLFQTLAVSASGSSSGGSKPALQSQNVRAIGSSARPPPAPFDLNLMQDIPGWLRSLRLHKFTDNLKDMRWYELVQLDDKGLEARGVDARGARNKFLKVARSIDSLKIH
jgi:hypothetical protein